LVADGGPASAPGSCFVEGRKQGPGPRRPLGSPNDPARLPSRRRPPMVDDLAWPSRRARRPDPRQRMPDRSTRMTQHPDLIVPPRSMGLVVGALGWMNASERIEASQVMDEIP